MKRKDLWHNIKHGAGVILALLVLCACAAPAEQEIIPTRTRKPGAIPTPTEIPALFIAAARPTVAPMSEVAVTPALGCQPETISAGMHLSASGSYTETEDSAAGPMICRIQRGSCAFRRLVGNLDPEILFSRHKPPPFDAEDTLIHPAMLLPLTRLKELVEAEWGGQVMLLVTAAYDSSLQEHDLAQSDNSRKYSLHFEGRSIDLVTYPVDSARHARLCALAHCAGFDWVNNEGDHCHASVQATSLCLQCSGESP
jgi:hypothetical protein